MWKNKLMSVMLAMAAATALVAATGCTSEEKPSAVTGQQVTGTDPAAYDQFGKYHAEWEGKPYLNPRYTDQKNRYHPEWVGASGH